MHKVLLIISAITPAYASSTTYHISYNSCFSYSLVLFVLFYCINQLLESANHFSLILLLGRIFLSATHIRPFFLRSYYINNLSLSIGLRGVNTFIATYANIDLFYIRL